MYGEQIEEIVKRDSKMNSIFGGVYPRDLVPPLQHWQKVFYIWNTEDHTEDGQHWILTGINKHNRIIYADPLGFPYPKYGEHVVRWIEAPQLPVHFLNRSIQSNTSVLCGGFCIMILWMIAHDYSLGDIENVFSLNPAKNDQIVQAFCMSKLRVNLKYLVAKNDILF